MTVTMDDLDLASMLSGLIQCEYMVTPDDRCPNEAQWVRTFLPCGCPLVACTSCKTISEGRYAALARRRAIQCGRCLRVVSQVRWDEL